MSYSLSGVSVIKATILVNLIFIKNNSKIPKITEKTNEKIFLLLKIRLKK